MCQKKSPYPCGSWIFPVTKMTSLSGLTRKKAEFFFSNMDILYIVGKEISMWTKKKIWLIRVIIFFLGSIFHQGSFLLGFHSLHNFKLIKNKMYTIYLCIYDGITLKIYPSKPPTSLLKKLRDSPARFLVSTAIFWAKLFCCLDIIKNIFQY